MVTDGKRSGDVVSTGDGRDTVPIEFVGASSPWVGDVEMEIRGELLSRVEFLSTQTVTSP